MAAVRSPRPQASGSSLGEAPPKEQDAGGDWQAIAAEPAQS